MTRERIHFLFLNIGHFLDHLFTLIFATVAALVQCSYRLIAPKRIAFPHAKNTTARWGIRPPVGIVTEPF